MEHSGIKIPFFAFFAHDSGKRPKEAPLNMLIAMGMAATMCVGLGIFYPLLYSLLPTEPMAHHHGHDEPYAPYTVPHVITMLQLLLFAVLAFVFLTKTRLYPAEVRAMNLDTDWFYRKPLPWLISGIGAAIARFDSAVRREFIDSCRRFIGRLREEFNESGLVGRTWATNTMAFWSAVLLAVFLLIYYG
jgi:multicomponent Na+:H+ antiporter subunit D